MSFEFKDCSAVNLRLEIDLMYELEVQVGSFVGKYQSLNLMQVYL